MNHALVVIGKLQSFKLVTILLWLEVFNLQNTEAESRILIKDKGQFEGSSTTSQLYMSLIEQKG